jgi:hypothetical protein
MRGMTADSFSAVLYREATFAMVCSGNAEKLLLVGSGARASDRASHPRHEDRRPSPTRRSTNSRRIT